MLRGPVLKKCGVCEKCVFSTECKLCKVECASSSDTWCGAKILNREGFGDYFCLACCERICNSATVTTVNFRDVGNGFLLTLDKFPFLPLVNQGNTCHMDTALQLLFHCFVTSGGVPRATGSESGESITRRLRDLFVHPRSYTETIRWFEEFTSQKLRAQDSAARSFHLLLESITNECNAIAAGAAASKDARDQAHADEMREWLVVGFKCKRLRSRDAAVWDQFSAIEAEMPQNMTGALDEFLTFYELRMEGVGAFHRYVGMNCGNVTHSTVLQDVRMRHYFSCACHKETGQLQSERHADEITLRFVGAACLKRNHFTTLLRFPDGIFCINGRKRIPIKDPDEFLQSQGEVPFVMWKVVGTTWAQCSQARLERLVRQVSQSDAFFEAAMLVLRLLSETSAVYLDPHEVIQMAEMAQSCDKSAHCNVAQMIPCLLDSLPLYVKDFVLLGSIERQKDQWNISSNAFSLKHALVVAIVQSGNTSNDTTAAKNGTLLGADYLVAKVSIRGGERSKDVYLNTTVTHNSIVVKGMFGPGSVTIWKRHKD